MKTLVYQSFRTSDVPGWVTRRMKSVRGWAADRGFDYQFFDDRFFEYAPDWYREKVKHHRLLVGDLARLELGKKFLAEGYDRTIWIDADVIVFDSENFNVDIREDFAFCRNI